MNRKRRESKQTVIVVLEGIKVSMEKKGVAPLCRAIRSVVNPDDEILVLTLLYVKATEPSAKARIYKDHQCNQSCEADPYISFLHQEISQKKEVYKKIFRPFYHGCKRNGVKFQVKIAAGFRLKDIIIEEANSIRATWLVIDSCFARHLSFRLSGTDCNVSLVSDGEEEEAMVHKSFLANDGPESLFVRDIDHNPKSPKLMKGSMSTEEPGVCSSSSAANSQYHPCFASVLVTINEENENQTEPLEESEILRTMKPTREGDISQDTVSVRQKTKDTISPNKANILLGQPVQLSWEVIVEITQGFKSRIFRGQNKSYLTYYGYLEDHQSFVLVKRFKGDSGHVLEAEKKAALSLHHKNILGLIGYHRNENETILVFPFDMEMTLERCLCDLSGSQWELTFENKLKIAIGTAQGIRYLHEECPRGPIAHGELQPSNIFLTSDWQPMISGFERAKWLQPKQKSPVPSNRFSLKDSLDRRSMALIKSDVLSFGILLLRLFCRKSLPQDDKILVEMARPLLLQRAFHMLLEEDSDDLDVHAIYRVMTTVTLCTRTKPISRPCMSEVISILKGENFCLMQSSPSDNSA